MERDRNFSFTWNNYPEEAEEYLRSRDCRYIGWGKEVGESGTPHLQGLIVYKTLKTLKQVIKELPGCHVEYAKNLEALKTYCQKDGKFEEVGDFPMNKKRKAELAGEGNAKRFKDAFQAAVTGNLDEIDADLRVRYYRTWKEIQKDHMPDMESIPELNNEWISGPSGCGKTRSVMERYPNAYLKTANKWWDGYQGQPVVLIDDLDEAHKCLVHHLKIWGDHKPFLAETKGGMIKIRPERIICTSNCRIEEMAQGSHLDALKRRYKVNDYYDPSYSSNFKQI